MNCEAIVRGVRMLKIVKVGSNGLRRLHTSNKVRRIARSSRFREILLRGFIDWRIAKCSGFLARRENVSSIASSAWYSIES